jgi:arylsulfatase
LVGLADLFGIATSAAGAPEMRDGTDVLGMLECSAAPRDCYFGYYGTPGTPLFKVMVRSGDWKYIFIANGGREQLFNITEDPSELNQRTGDSPDVVNRLREKAIEALSVPNADRALDGTALRRFPYEPTPRERIYQFDWSRGVEGFPEHPGDALKK